MTIVEFLTARYDGLEALALALIESGGDYPSYPHGSNDTELAFMAATSPTATLADIAAKRAILRLAEDQFQPHPVMDGMSWEQYDAGLTAAYRAVVLLFCQPFAEHADFDPAWRV